MYSINLLKDYRHDNNFNIRNQSNEFNSLIGGNIKMTELNNYELNNTIVVINCILIVMALLLFLISKRKANSITGKLEERTITQILAFSAGWILIAIVGIAIIKHLIINKK